VQRTYGDITSVPQQDPTFHRQFTIVRSIPLFLATSLLLGVDNPIDRPILGVNNDLVAIPDERNGPSKSGFRYYMAFIERKRKRE